MASWVVHSSPERAVWVRALAGDVVLCFGEDTYHTLTVEESDLRWTSIPSRGSRNTPSPASSPVVPASFNVTSPVKLVGRTRARIQASSFHLDSGNWPGDKAAPSRFMLQKPRNAPAAISQSWLQGFTSDK